MRKCITLLVCIFCSSLTWGQYQTAYQTGVSDITGHLATSNAWVYLPSNTWLSSLSTGSDGTLAATDPSLNLKVYNSTSRTWSVHGTGWRAVAVQDSSHIYLLLNAQGPGTACQITGNTAIYLWDGVTGHAPVFKVGCLKTISVSPDGTIVGTVMDGGIWLSTDGTVTWSQIGSGFNYVSAASQTSMCATTATQAFMLQSNGTFAALPTQPASSGIKGCVLTTDNDSIFAWGTFGVKRYDLKAGTWNVVTGLVPGPTVMTTGRKGTTFALNNSVPYHLNVYAGFVQGTTTGSTNGCPVNQCQPSGVVHTGTLKVSLPHGIYGAQAQQAVPPTTNMNVSSFDVSPTCDPIYGDPSDPECQGLGTGGVICSASGSNFTPNGPGNPPHIGAHFSEWVGSYSGNYVIESQTQNGLPPDHALYIATIACGAIDTCRPPSSAVCSPPRIAGVFTEIGADWGAGASKPGALAAAVEGCQKHSITGFNGKGPGAWGAYSNYDVVPGLPPVCSPAVVFDATPYVSSCY